MDFLAQLPSSVIATCRRLAEAGHSVHLVGGAVRDFLLGRPTSDFDLASSASPEQVTSLFDHVIPTGWRHGTVTVVQPDGLQVEVTTYRSDGAYSDGRHPDQVVLGGGIEGDLARRDFTVNAMAVAYPGGALIDPCAGAADVARKTLKAVGIAGERFAEDALRMLRAARLAAVLEFDLEAATRAAMQAQASGITRVAAERQRDELIKLLAARTPSIGLRILAETGLLAKILPELAACAGVEQAGSHEHDVLEHTMRAVDLATFSDVTLRLALLLHDIGKPGCARGQGDERSFHGHESAGADLASGVLERLHLPRQDLEQVIGLIAGHMWHYTPDWSDGAVRRFLLRVGGPAAMDRVFAFRDADLRARGTGGLQASLHASLELRARTEHIIEQKQALRVKDLALDGRAVGRVLGVHPGPVIGQALAWLHERVLDQPEFNTTQALTALLQDWQKASRTKDL